jgi:hypothetical protein
LPAAGQDQKKPPWSNGMILRAALIIGMCSTAALASAQQFLPPPIPPTNPNRALVTWTPGDAQCGGVPIAIGPLVRRPLNSLGWSPQDNLKPVTFRFTIDDTGRPLSIARVGSDYIPFADDLGPALAASRFPSRAREACQITYSPKAVPLAEAPVGDLVSYTISPIGGMLPKEGWDRIRPAGDCMKPPMPAPLFSAFPDFARLPGTPGVLGWTLVGYDIDGRGKAANVHVVSGNGNPALEQASVKAMRDWKFAGGPRTGCLYPYHRNAVTLAAPTPPEEETFRPVDATCTEPRNWTRPLALQFPDNYRRRMIEGWAIVRYDVAPWGAVGNVKVLASQPSEDFGKQATMMLQGATLPASRGMTGCIDRVRYVLDPNRPPTD